MTDDELKLLAVSTSLKKMFAGSHFSICTLDEAIKTLGCIADADAYRILRALHCVDWKDMPTALRNEVPALVSRCLATQWPPPGIFDRPPVQVVIQERVVEVEKPRRSLLGWRS